MARERLPYTDPQGGKDATPIGRPDHRYTGEVCPECGDPWCVGCEHADVARD